MGAAFGDLALQATHKFYEGDNWALAGWGGASLPTGNVTGDPASYSGAGVWSGEAGLVGIWQQDDWEASANLGYEQPFGTPPLSTASFYVGQALLYQLQANYSLSYGWRVGVGVGGYRGIGRFGTDQLNVPMGKFAVMPSVQYAWNTSQGMRVSAGVDPTTLGTDALTGMSASVVFYQYLR
jgi:hypothetical protein